MAQVLVVMTLRIENGSHLRTDPILAVRNVSRLDFLTLRSIVSHGRLSDVQKIWSIVQLFYSFIVVGFISGAFERFTLHSVVVLIFSWLCLFFLNITSVLVALPDTHNGH